MSCSFEISNTEVPLVKVKSENKVMDNQCSIEFKEIMEKFHSERKKEVHLDLSEIELMNSSAMGKLLLFYKKFEKINGLIRIVSINPSLRETFHILNFNDIFEMDE